MSCSAKMQSGMLDRYLKEQPNLLERQVAKNTNADMKASDEREEEAMKQLDDMMRADSEEVMKQHPDDMEKVSHTVR